MAEVALKKIHEETCCEFRAILAAKGTKAQTTQQKVSKISSFEITENWETLKEK